MSEPEGRVTYPDLHGRHVVVTGGATGIGASIASAFLAQGARVSVLDIVSSEAPPPSGAHYAFEWCDLRDPSAISATLESCRSRLGPVEILVNNAARDDRHTLEVADAALWDDLMAINLRAAHLAARAAVPDMLGQGHGVIINLSSNSFLLGLEGYPVYTTAKAGLLGLTKALARELGHHRIRVNCLAPGWVMTEKQKRLWVTPEARQKCLDAQCLKQEIEPEDIASPCLFLASDASRMMTGQMLIVDGGRV